VAVLEGVLDFTSKKPEGFFSTSRSDDLSDVRELPTGEDTVGIFDLGVRVLRRRNLKVSSPPPGLMTCRTSENCRLEKIP
jgi:hypothetical protein